MDYRFNESYPFVFIGHVCQSVSQKATLQGQQTKKNNDSKRGGERGREGWRERKQTQSFHVLHVTVTKQKKRS